MRSGTLFHGSKLPLTIWFQAIYLITQNKNCLSALSLMRHLGVSYRAAWRLKHKLLETLAEREEVRQLDGVVVADDAYLGGKRPGKRGRGAQNKVPFVAAVELDADGHPWHVRFDPIADLTAGSVENWARRALGETVQLVTDGLASFSAAAVVVQTYGAIIVTPHRSGDLEPFRWVNTFIANLKTAIRAWDLPSLQVPQVHTPLPRRGAISHQPTVRPPVFDRAPAAYLRKDTTGARKVAAPSNGAGWLRHDTNHLYVSCFWRAALMFQCHSFRWMAHRQTIYLGCRRYWRTSIILFCSGDLMVFLSSQ